MKIRYGFVSNSSSASFIIMNGSVKDIATKMLNVVIKEFKGWNHEDTSEWSRYDKWKDNLIKALETDDVKNGKIGIRMPSCNYDTYIIKEGIDVYVSTCRNHDFRSLEDSATYLGGGEDDGDDDKTYKVINENSYFNVENNKIHSVEHECDEKECPKCKQSYGSYVLIDGKQICSGCYESEIK